MRVIERSEYRDEEGKIHLTARLQGTLDCGFGWYARMQAQDTLTRRLARVLDDRHFLLRNVPIPGIDPCHGIMILVSPQGVRALFAHTVRGVFRAQGEEWLRFHNRRREFRPARKDLQSEALSLAAQVRRFLESQEVGVRDVEAVLVFTHPRTLVDSATPRARVVPADAIEYFAANLEQLPARLEKERVRLVVERLLEPFRAEAELPPMPEPEPPHHAEVRAPERVEAEPPPPSPPSEPAPSQVELAPAQEAYPDWQALRQAQEEAYQQAQASGLEVQEKPEPPAPREPRFKLGALTTGQWIILGVLLLLEALVLIAFVLLVFTDLLLS